ncbi:hypothetical protein [Marinoscillum sp.]|uniref:hypothetical protein n=1 Tax=Marinoscillum sp. TaxID=2024838 RepID=UPI003BA8DB4D
MSDYALKLKFHTSKIDYYASRYSYGRSELEVIQNTQQIKSRGYLTKKELQIIGEWKTPRTKSRVASNAEDYIKEITQIAFSTNSEKLRVEILNLLTGVSWPTASVLLHFYHTDRYPIIDFRALYSLSCEHIKPQDYRFEFWQQYTDFTRGLADQANVDMRTLDQALWQYSKEIQKT